MTKAAGALGTGAFLFLVAALAFQPQASAAPRPAGRTTAPAIGSGGGWIRPDAEEASLFKPEAPQSASSPKADMASTREALSLSMGSRLEALKGQGPQGYRNLVAIMFDEKSPMQQRWKATTAVGRLGGELSQPELERAYKRKEWFMRSAALLAMRNVNKERALSWATALLSDRALVVRSAAVDAVAEIASPASAPILWKKLYSHDNFNEGESLWIRRRIVETLARLEGPGAESKFVKVLADKDVSLHGPAVDALERISKRRLGEPGATVEAKRDLWLKASKTKRI